LDKLDRTRRRGLSCLPGLPVEQVVDEWS
jgi:hypothetical protein